METLVASRDSFNDWKSLIYVAMFVLLPALSSLGKKLRERFSDSEKTSDAVKPVGSKLRQIRRAGSERVANAAKRVGVRGRKTASMPPPPSLPKSGSRTEVESHPRVPTASPVAESLAKPVVQPMKGSLARRVRSSVRSKSVAATQPEARRPAGSRREHANQPAKSRRRLIPPTPPEGSQKPEPASGLKGGTFKQMASPGSLTNAATGDQGRPPAGQPGLGVRIEGIGRVSAEKMRQAVILSEILMPPLAMRDLDEWC